MKRRWLLLPIVTLALILTFTLLPINFLFADKNLINDSGFDNGLDEWEESLGVTMESGAVCVSGDYDTWRGVWQFVNTSNKNLHLVFDYKLAEYVGEGMLSVGFMLYMGGPIDFVDIRWILPPDEDEWNYGENWNISDLWADQHGGAALPDFNRIEIFTGTYDAALAYYDNIKLLAPGQKGESKEEEPQPWVRDREFQCWQVWVNEADQFEFVFVWEYANNNHVQILDKDGNIVFYIDLPKGDCHFTADLPDGTYTVQNYHEYGHILREFTISKP